MNICFYQPEWMHRATIQKTRLWLDFARETCKAFDAKFYFVGQQEHARHSRGKPEPIVVSGWVQTPAPHYLLTCDEFQANADFCAVDQSGTIIIGADDGEEPRGIENRIYIQTPVSYPLWGSVAAGIALHEILK